MTPAPVPRPGGELRGGVLADYAVEGETFRVWVTNPETIERLTSKARGESEAEFPSGPILPGPGAGEHNAPWEWHFDPSQVTIAESGSASCDGRPSEVQVNLDHYINVAGRYCPLRADLLVITTYPE